MPSCVKCNNQKLIKIADRSELGWAVLNEYTANELAKNSDDEKLIEKAEKAAERKDSRKRKGTSSGREEEERLVQLCEHLIL